MIQEAYPEWKRKADGNALFDGPRPDSEMSERIGDAATWLAKGIADRYTNSSVDYGTSIDSTTNPSGIIPVEFKVLVKLDPVETITRGGIVLPQSAVNDSQIQQTEATLIAVGGRAFEGFGDPTPQIGDRVIIARYAGERPKAKDNEASLFRLCNDKDICAIVRKA